MRGVFVVGSLHLDIVLNAPHLPQPDETVVGTAVDYAFGGKGGNQAVAAALHGAPTAMAGRVGSDAFADQLLAFLDQAGVDRRAVQRGDGASGMSAAIVDAAGAYGAVIVSAANLSIDADLIDLPADAAILLLQNEIPEAVNLSTARRARAAGLGVILNAAPARRVSPALLDLIDLLVVNRVEAAALSGLDAAAAAAESFGTECIVTLGAEGLVHARDGVARHHPGFAVPVVSTHGAGDCFVGALGARLAAGDTTEDAIPYAQAAAALHVSRPPGDRLTVTPEAVRAFLATHR